jgi:hypothetical protein
LAALPGGGVSEALDRLVERERRLPLVAKLEAHFLLWKVTRDRSNLETARGLLTELHAHAPERDRDALISRVPLYRDVQVAWVRTSGRTGGRPDGRS